MQSGLQSFHIAPFRLPLGDELSDFGVALRQLCGQSVCIVACQLIEAVGRHCCIYGGECLHRIPDRIGCQLQRQSVGCLSLAESRQLYLPLAAIQQIEGLALCEQQLIAQDGKQMLFTIGGCLAIRHDTHTQ